MEAYVLSSTSPQTPGRVYLVGAGPGDPGLLTLRGRECLAEADLILYDGLVNPDLLRHTRAEAVRTCRSEGPNGLRVPQADINRQLIEAATAGRTVVRLKGGDPFVFGRGTEEAAALREAGIPFEVVPGITAATAAAVYTGISLTHREMSSAVAFVTGHEDPLRAEQRLGREALANFPGTLVYYMGLNRLKAIAESLISAGKSPHTPAMVVCRATTPAQKTVIGPLANIATLAQQAALHAPSLLMIGDVVNLRETAAWFEHRPLFGLNIGITRPEDQADDAISLCYRLGAQPVALPTIEILPPESWSDVDVALNQLDQYQWLVFTSMNGVHGLLDRLWQTGGDARRIQQAKLAVIGPSTAAALEKYGLRADLIPAEFRAEALARKLKPAARGQRVLWARASRGRDVLPTELNAAGATVDQVVVYRNQDVTAFDASVLRKLEAGDLDWIGLSSPSIARNLPRLLTPAARKQIGSRTRLASISPVTTAAAQEAGLPIAAEAASYTWPGIFAAIESCRP